MSRLDDLASVVTFLQKYVKDKHFLPQLMTECSLLETWLEGSYPAQHIRNKHTHDFLELLSTYKHHIMLPDKKLQKVSHQDDSTASDIDTDTTATATIIEDVRPEESCQENPQNDASMKEACGQIVFTKINTLIADFDFEVNTICVCLCICLCLCPCFFLYFLCIYRTLVIYVIRLLRFTTLHRSH
jgi:hypothetical protein